MRPVGGAVLLNGSTSPLGPHGELIVRDAFLAFYENPTQAKVGAQGIQANAARTGGTLEQHGTVATLWIHPPSNAERSAVDGCIPG